MKIAVFGGSRFGENTHEYQDAFTFCSELAEKSECVITGGYEGIMEASNAAFSSHGKDSIGVTCIDFSSKETEPNKFLTMEVKTKGLLERLQYIRDNSDIAIALVGELGTLHEILTYLNFHAVGESKTRILMLDTWKPVFESLGELGVVDTTRLSLNNSLEFYSYDNLIKEVRKAENELKINYI